MKYRRVFVPGGTYFFTLVTYKRRPIFVTPQAVETLRSALRYTMERHPFAIIASVIMPEHMHFIWTLPPNDSDFPTRWRLIKGHCIRLWCTKEDSSESTSRIQKREQDIWQRRFWEHLHSMDIFSTPY
jgi:putative transposase